MTGENLIKYLQKEIKWQSKTLSIDRNLGLLIGKIEYLIGKKGDYEKENYN